MDDFDIYNELFVKSYDTSKYSRFQLELEYFVKKAQEKQRALKNGVAIPKKKVLKFLPRNDNETKKHTGKGKSRVSNFLACKAIIEDREYHKSKKKDFEPPKFYGHISGKLLELESLNGFQNLQIVELVQEQVMKEMQNIENRVKSLQNYLDDPGVSADTPIP